MRATCSALVALFSLMVVGACAAAQLNAEEPKTPKDPDVKTAPKNPREDVKTDPPAGESVPLDPTLKSKALRDAENPPAPKVEKPATVVVAAPAPPPLPALVLKAFVEAEGMPPSALLEINGKAQLLVAEGSEFSVHSDKQYLTLKVKKVARGGVEIEVVQLKQTIYIK